VVSARTPPPPYWRRSAATGTDSPTPAAKRAPRGKSHSKDATAPRTRRTFPRGRACPASTPECAARARDRRIAGSSFFLRQHTLQFLLRLEQPRLGGPFGHLHDAGDLRMLEPFDLEQQKHHPVFRMYPPQRALDRQLER